MRRYYQCGILLLAAIILITGFMMLNPAQAQEDPPLPEDRDLLIDSTEGGLVTAPGEGYFSFMENDVINLVAEAETGYIFLEWTGDTATIADATAATTTITMNGYYSITANFVPLVCNLTVSSTEGGSVTTPGEGVFTYSGGEAVNLVAETETGCQFTGWTGDTATIADNTTTTTITMKGHHGITANFAHIQHNLTLHSGRGGSVTTPGEGIFAFNEGETVNLLAEAAQGYRFVAWYGDVATITDSRASSTSITINGDYSLIAFFSPSPQVACGDSHSVGVKEDGTVVVNYVPDGLDIDYGQFDVGDWTDIVQAAAGVIHTVGIKSDGTMAATGENYDVPTIISEWTDIVQVTASNRHTVGLKSNGRLATVPMSESSPYNYGQLDVGDWTGIVQVSTSVGNTAGLKADGTVLVAGNDTYSQCNVSGWTDIVQVEVGGGHTVGLKSDGTVIAAGNNSNGQCNVSGWTDIVQVEVGGGHTVGLKSDGTVVATGYNGDGECNVSGWTDIVQIACGHTHTVGLKPDDSAVATGDNYHGECNTWNAGAWLAPDCQDELDAYSQTIANLDSQITQLTQTIADLEAQIAGTLPGDANGDGELNALDVTKTERLIVGLD